VDGEIIIDNIDPGFSTESGDEDWKRDTSADDQYGQCHMYHRTVGSGEDVAKWEFEVPEAGQYEVYAWWCASDTRPNDVPYTVHHANGSSPVRVDQTTNGGQWNTLGTYTFDGSGSVTLTDDADTGRNLVADAVRLVPVEGPGGPAANPSALTERTFLPMVGR